MKPLRPIETFTRDDYTIAVHHDEDCPNPREDACPLGVFVGLPHRCYRIGDEQIDPREYPFRCAECHGTGTTTETAIQPGSMVGSCLACDEAGERGARSMVEFGRLLQAERGARILLPVGLYDHSGVAYYIGGGSHRQDPQGWDSGLAGFIFDTPTTLTECWGDATPSDEQITEALTGEIAVYSQWANGECFGYTVTGPDGTEIDACWGYLGTDSWFGGDGYLIEAAQASIDAHRAAAVRDDARFASVSQPVTP